MTCSIYWSQSLSLKEVNKGVHTWAKPEVEREPEVGTLAQ